MKLGQKIYFNGEKQPMKVKALTERFAIVTKPFNPQRTVIYSILDFKEQKKAPNNLVFNIYDYAIQEDIDECMKDLLSGECELSRRNSVDLNIDWERTGSRELKLERILK